MIIARFSPDGASRPTAVELLLDAQTFTVREIAMQLDGVPVLILIATCLCWKPVCHVFEGSSRSPKLHTSTLLSVRSTMRRHLIIRRASGPTKPHNHSNAVLRVKTA
jgi:hypothetical protein